MSNSQPFSINTPNVSIAATQTSGNVGIGNVGAPRIIIFNSGTDVAFVKSGDSTVTATTSDMFIAPGTSQLFQLNTDHNHVAAIMLSGKTATIYFAPGQGE